MSSIQTSWMTLIALSSLATTVSMPLRVEGLDSSTNDNAAIDPSGERLDLKTWEHYWKHFASRCVKIEDQYFTCPRYNSNFPSSAHITSKDFQKKHAKIIRWQYRGHLSQKRTKEMPATDDAHVASHLIPKVAIGEYGFIHSCQVERIIGPQEMLGRYVWLLDNNALRHERSQHWQQVYRSHRNSEKTTNDVMSVRYKVRDAAAKYQKTIANTRIHFIGFKTKDLVSGMRWSGPQDRGVQIAIIGMSEDPDQAYGVRYFVAIPVRQIKRGLTQDQFKEFLAKRGKNVNEFCDLIKKEYRRNSDNFKERVFKALNTQVNPSE